MTPSANRYPAAGLGPLVGLAKAAMSAVRPNQTNPPIATGTPATEPYRLRYACVQLKVALTSHGLT